MTREMSMGIGDEYPAMPIANTKVDNRNIKTMEEMVSTLTRVQRKVHAASQPVTAILALSELISHSTDLDEMTRSDINTIYEQAFLLKSLIHELQDIVATQGY
ncbi:MAG TPA: hypothetical protein VH186_19685 [Chloroflexia bacterium]|nr:hypothetical protein [Chloroflexia bacterium]